MRQSKIQARFFQVRYDTKNLKLDVLLDVHSPILVSVRWYLEGYHSSSHVWEELMGSLKFFKEKKNSCTKLFEDKPPPPPGP